MRAASDHLNFNDSSGKHIILGGKFHLTSSVWCVPVRHIEKSEQVVEAFISHLGAVENHNIDQISQKAKTSGNCNIRFNATLPERGK